MSKIHRKPAAAFRLLCASFLMGSFACASSDDGTGGALAEPAAARHEPAEAPASAGRAVVAELHAALTAVIIDSKSLGYPGRYDALAPVLLRLFNVRTMARATLGPKWNTLSREQQESWVEVFGRFHVSAAALRHRDDRGQRFRILGEEVLGDGLLLVQTQIDYPGRGVDIYVDYRLREGVDGWRVVDIHDPPSVSDVAMRRSEYATVLDRGGIDALVAMMEERIAKREGE